MSEDERQTYVDMDCWQLEDGRTFVGNRAVETESIVARRVWKEYVPLAEVERLRGLLCKVYRIVGSDELAREIEEAVPDVLPAPMGTKPGSR